MKKLIKPLGVTASLFALTFVSVTMADTYNISGKTDETACGESVRFYSETALVTVIGNQVSATVHGHTRTGTLVGNSITYSVSYPEDEGITTSKGSITINQDGTITGNLNWNWSNSKFSCSGTDTFSGIKEGACGDERDDIISEYKKYKVSLTPKCDDFSQSASSSNYLFSQFNTGDYSYALVRQPLITSTASGYGLDTWIKYIGKVHSINSAYRNPVHNFKPVNEGGAGSTAKQSRHMFGDAVDLKNETRTLKEYGLLKKAASTASADYIEPWTGPCKNGCVHADWRKHSGVYAKRPTVVNSRLAVKTHSSVVINQTKSQSWQIRENAFRTLQKNLPDTSKQLKSRNNISNVFVSLLAKESQYVATSSDLPEEYTTYYGDLIDVVANIKDIKSVNVLLKPSVLTTGNMVIEGLASFGDKVIQKVINNLYESTSDTERVALIQVMTSMLSRGTIKEFNNKQSVEVVLLKAVKDSDPFIKLNSIRGLSYFNDLTAQKAIMDVSLFDSYIVDGDYPVRNEAKELLQKAP